MHTLLQAGPESPVATLTEIIQLIGLVIGIIGGGSMAGLGALWGWRKLARQRTELAGAAKAEAEASRADTEVRLVQVEVNAREFAVLQTYLQTINTEIIGPLQADIKQLRTELNQQDQKIDHLEADNRDLRGSVEHLDRQNRSLKRQLSGLRKVMQDRALMTDKLQQEANALMAWVKQILQNIHAQGDDIAKLILGPAGDPPLISVTQIRAIPAEFLEDEGIWGPLPLSESDPAQLPAPSQ